MTSTKVGEAVYHVPNFKGQDGGGRVHLHVYGARVALCGVFPQYSRFANGERRCPRCVDLSDRYDVAWPDEGDAATPNAETVRQIVSDAQSAIDSLLSQELRDDVFHLLHGASGNLAMALKRLPDAPADA